MQHPASEFPQVSQRRLRQRIFCDVIAQALGFGFGPDNLESHLCDLRRTGEIPLLFVVYRPGTTPLALGISCGRGNGASSAIGRNDYSAR
jgi:hypothetical protein